MLSLGAMVIQSTAAGLNQQFTFRQSFTLVAYGMAPLFLGRWLDCVPAINTWVCWAVGASAMVYTLYQGVGEVMKPEITKGFGLYLICAGTLFLLSGLMHFLVVTTLHGGHL